MFEILIYVIICFEVGSVLIQGNRYASLYYHLMLLGCTYSISKKIKYHDALERIASIEVFNIRLIITRIVIAVSSWKN